MGDDKLRLAVGNVCLSPLCAGAYHVSCLFAGDGHSHESGAVRLRHWRPGALGRSRLLRRHLRLTMVTMRARRRQLLRHQSVITLRRRHLWQSPVAHRDRMARPRTAITRTRRHRTQTTVTVAADGARVKFRAPLREAGCRPGKAVGETVRRHRIVAHHNLNSREPKGFHCLAVAAGQDLPHTSPKRKRGIRLRGRKCGEWKSASCPRLRFPLVSQARWPAP
jgi:hypothetical protein